MSNMLENYSFKVFEKQNIKKLYNTNISLPLYLKSFTYEVFNLYGKNYVFVTPNNDIDFKQYNVFRNEIEKRFGCEAIIVLQNCDFRKRKNLISHNILFVEIDKQIFIPTLGVVISNLRESRVVEVSKKFTAQTQLVALFFIYEKTKNIVVKDIVNKTHLNEMAISRALSILEKLNLIKHNPQGKKKIYNLTLNKSEYIDKIINFCSCPISKIVVINKELLSNNYLSNYSALSRYTELIDNDISYAISKETYKKINGEFEPFIDGFIYDDNMIKCEIWKYDPAIYAEEGIVDRFSLLLSFDKNNVDERTDGALDELMRGLKDEI